MREFICVWFESVPGWFYQTDQQETGGPFGTITEAANAARALRGWPEASFDVAADHGDYYHFVRSDGGSQ